MTLFGVLLLVVKAAVYLLLGVAFGSGLSGYRERPLLRGINLGVARLVLGMAIGIPIVIIGPIVFVEAHVWIGTVVVVLFRMGLWFAVTKAFFGTTPNVRIAGFSFAAAVLVTVFEMLTLGGDLRFY
jgi:hypothetical protein